jgi:hypothetical protein
LSELCSLLCTLHALWVAICKSTRVATTCAANIAHPASCTIQRHCGSMNQSIEQQDHRTSRHTRRCLLMVKHSSSTLDSPFYPPSFMLPLALAPLFARPFALQSATRRTTCDFSHIMLDTFTEPHMWFVVHALQFCKSTSLLYTACPASMLQYPL